MATIMTPDQIADARKVLRAASARGEDVSLLWDSLNEATEGMVRELVDNPPHVVTLEPEGGWKHAFQRSVAKQGSKVIVLPESDEFAAAVIPADMADLAPEVEPDEPGLLGKIFHR